MKKLPYDSLRGSLVLPFVLLGFVVSALLSLVAFGLVASLEERDINRMLHVEIESFHNRLALNPGALPPTTALLFGQLLPAPGFPSLASIKDGYGQTARVVHNGRDYSVMVTDLGGKPYALFYDRTYLISSLRNLALYLLMGTCLMTLLSFLVGNHLASQVVRPINKLLDEISDKSARTILPASSPLTFSAIEYPNNEIGRMVQALDQYAFRLYAFVERESCFAADVSHELRTPLAVIRGATEVLSENNDLPEAVRQRVQTIHRQAVRMGQILEAMLLLSRERGGAEDPACAMAEVVAEAIADVSPTLADLPVSFVVEYSEHPILPVERSLAYVVVSNLLRNACAFTRAGTINVRLDANGMAIVDSGIGIAEDRFPELFTRHIKGQESSGYGLGLSIVSRVAQRLGWTLDIQSRSGSGTTVSIAFPMNSESAGVT